VLCGIILLCIKEKKLYKCKNQKETNNIVQHGRIPECNVKIDHPRQSNM